MTESPAAPFETVISPIAGRADAAIKRLLDGYSRAEVAKLFRDKNVRRNGRALKAGDDVIVGEELEVPADAVSSSVTFARPNSQIEMAVVFENEQVVVANKPPGLPSHPLQHNDSNSALSAILATHPDVATAGEDAREGGLLHRLDTFTGGALAFAKTAQAWRVGRALFSPEHPDDARAERAYLALVGTPAAEGLGRDGTDVFDIDFPIAHHPGEAKKMVVVDDDERPHRGKPRAACTWGHVLAMGPTFTAMIVRAVGGRRHQVRVHLAHLGLPLVGDHLYAGPPWPADETGAQHALWALGLRFPLSAFGSDEWVVAPPFGLFAETLTAIDGTLIGAAASSWRARLKTLDR